MIAGCNPRLASNGACEMKNRMPDMGGKREKHRPYLQHSTTSPRLPPIKTPASPRLYNPPQRQSPGLFEAVFNQLDGP